MKWALTASTSVVAALMLVGCGGGMSGNTVRADYAKEVARAKANGFDTLDNIAPRVSPDDNAAPLLANLQKTIDTNLQIKSDTKLLLSGQVNYASQEVGEATRRLDSTFNTSRSIGGRRVFRTELELDDPNAAEYPQIGFVRRLCRLFMARARVHISRKEYGPAIQDLSDSLKLCQVLRGQPQILSIGVEVTVSELVLREFGDILEKLNRPQREKAITAIKDCLKDVPFWEAMRFEQAVNMQFRTLFLRDSSNGKAPAFIEQAAASLVAKSEEEVERLKPKGLNQVEWLDVLFGDLLRRWNKIAEATVGKRSDLDAIDKAIKDTNFDFGRATGKNLVSIMLFPVVRELIEATKSGLARRELLLSMADILTYREAHGGAWPTESQIKLPKDVYGTGPIKMKKLPEGLILYSVGPNGKDDDGWVGPTRDIVVSYPGSLREQRRRPAH